MPTRFDDGVDKQVEDLRERMRLLQQDRRANIDLLEANKLANENEIRSLKDDNKKLRIRLSNLQKSAVSDADNHLSDVDSLRRLVRQKRNEFDTQKASSKKLGTKLNKLKSEAVMEDNRPSPEDVELSRQIRQLENRLDKAMMQYNEAQGICSTYEHIVKRLKAERIEFDNQLTALERTLESKHRDFEELTLLCGDASHARDVAQHSLNKAKWSFDENKQRRSREIRERQQHIKVRKQIIKKQERAEEDKRRQQLGSADADGADVGGMSASNNSISVSQEQIADQEQKQLSVYENAFRKIKDATGINNVKEMIRKVVGQESTTKNLVSLSAQHQTTMEGLSRLQKSLVNDVQMVKCSLSVSSSANKKSTKPLDELQDTLYARSSQLDRAKSQLDRLEMAIVSTKAGVEHLRAKLFDLPDEFDVDSGNLAEMSLPDVIRSSGDILLDVMHARANNDDDTAQFNHVDHSTNDSNSSSSNNNKVRFSLDIDRNLQSRRPTTRGAAEVSVPFNQRIPLRSAKERTAFDQDDDCDDDGTDFGDLGMETISRKTLKKMSYHIVAAEERKRLLQQQQQQQQAASVDNG
jgi:chromosome segregation ATPase